MRASLRVCDAQEFRARCCTHREVSRSTQCEPLMPLCAPRAWRNVRRGIFVALSVAWASRAALTSAARLWQPAAQPRADDDGRASHTHAWSGPRRPWALHVQGERPSELCSGAPGAGKCGGREPRRREEEKERSRRLARPAIDPNFAANVGQAIDKIREDHAKIPRMVPGLGVASPSVALELAQLPAVRFEGFDQYQQFWGNFRTGVELVSTAARSEVVNVVHSGLYIRIRWRLVLTPRVPSGGQAAASALQAAKGALDTPSGAFGSFLRSAGAQDLLGEAERWVKEASDVASTSERIVELNSVYELDCWNGRVLKHTLEFRSPEEDFDLIGAIPTYR